MRKSLIAAGLVLLALWMWGSHWIMPREVRPMDLSEPTPSARVMPSRTRSLSLDEAGLDADAIDRSADPCSDFYRFACGRWIDSAVPADGNLPWTRIRANDLHARAVLSAILEEAAIDPGDDPLKREVGDFYRACERRSLGGLVKSGKLDPLRALIEDARDVAGFERAIAGLQRAGIPVFFAVRPVRDEADPSRLIAGISPVVGPLLVMPGLSARPMQIVPIVSRLQELNRRFPPEWHRRNRDSLRRDAPDFPWDDYFEDLGHPEWTDFDIESEEYVTGVDSILVEEPPEAIRAFLTFSLFDARILGTDSIQAAGRGCTEYTERMLHDDVGELYAERELSDRGRLVAWGMMGAISESLRARLPSVPWMDAPTRKAAFQKLDGMALLAGAPSRPRSPRFQLASDDWIDDALEIGRAETDVDLARIGGASDRGTWHVSPSTTNAFFDQLDDSLVFPAAILRRPFFDVQSLSAVDFGAIGAIMGHELTHGLDRAGGEFDPAGNRVRWYSQQARRAFEETRSCVVSQYFRLRSRSGTPDPKDPTAEENLADIGGLRLAWLAWQDQRSKDPAPPVEAEGFSESQMFFLSYAQQYCEKPLDDSPYRGNHSSGRLRAMAPLADMTEFSDAFECAKGTPMHPAETCSVW